MAEAGFEYVRMGELSWAVLEPERCQFEWLDEAVELVDEEPEILQACGRPTAALPW